MEVFWWAGNGCFEEAEDRGFLGGWDGSFSGGGDGECFMERNMEVF